MAGNFYQPYGYYGAPQPFSQQSNVMTPPVPTSPPAAQQSFSCRPVTSREEAVAVQADFFSMGTIMPDLAHGIVYLKRINQQTGAADFFEFVYRQPEAEQKPDYVTRQEFEEFVKSIQPKKKVKEAEHDE